MLGLNALQQTGRKSLDMSVTLPDPDALAVPALHLGIGVTGHRSNHPVFRANQAGIETALNDVMAMIGALTEKLHPLVVPCNIGPIRFLSLLAYGADLMAVKLALTRGWAITAPLPFGMDLNIAVNAQPNSIADMEAILAGADPADTEVSARAADIRAAAARAHLFELAEQDAEIKDLLRTQLQGRADVDAGISFQAMTSQRAAIAARVMIEQSDIIIGIWDGITHGSVGGTRHSISAALDLGVPVIWIDACNPADWRILTAPEMMADPSQHDKASRDTQLASIIGNALYPHGVQFGNVSLQERWRPRSNPILQAYRRVEALFGGGAFSGLKNLSQRYERADEIAQGSSAPLLAAARALPGGDPQLVANIGSAVLRPFAWADGVSTYLSDAYRGSMVTSFFLSALAIIGGIAYLPFATVDQKWGFAVFEFLLLCTIIAITFFGRRRRWHGRWFETRRVAEYFRHAPILLLLGVARSAGRWPCGPGAAWPEWYAIHAIGDLGLPRMAVTTAYLRDALILMRDFHVLPQREYHIQKASRLKRVQHNLDKMSERLFVLAVLSVAIYLAIWAGAALAWLPAGLPHSIAKTFTFLGVLFPTLGGAFAGVHYFGDFERFAAISEITAAKLDGISQRTEILLAAPDVQITYTRVSNLAHAIDEIVVSEIENWQAVFSGKNITVPV